jgi:UDP-glucuronate decarboxylase
MLETNSIIRNDLERISTTKLPWNLLSNKVIMVTGGAGFLGAYLVKSLLTANYKYDLNLRIVCVVRTLEGTQQRLADYLSQPDLSFFQHDISKPLPFNFPPADFIIHCASQASPKYYGVDPIGTLSANCSGTMFLLEHAFKHRSSSFLFFSSAEIYGLRDNLDIPIREHDCGYIDPMNIRSCYAESKRIGEAMCVAWSQQHDIHTAVVRPFHTYGPGMSLNDGRVFADFVSDFLANRDILLKSDGLAMRPFCYVADATIGFLTVLLKGRRQQAYNVANPHAEVSMRDLAHTVASLFPERRVGVRFEIRSPNKNYLKSSIMRQVPSIDKIAAIGWEPETDIRTGFKRTILSYL